MEFDAVRRALILSGAGFAAACSSMRPSPLSGSAAALRAALDGASFAPEDAARIPYACMGVRLGERPEALAVLASAEGDRLRWMSADRVLIETRHGRVTRWLDRVSRMEDHTGTGDPVGDGQLGRDGTESCTRRLDFPDDRRYGLVAVSTIATDRTGPDEPVPAFKETGSCEPLGWAFENRFFLNVADGTVQRSVQHVHPQLEPVQLRVLRPYRQPGRG